MFSSKNKIKKNRVLGCQCLNLGFSVNLFGSLELIENTEMDDMVSSVKNNRAKNALKKIVWCAWAFFLMARH
jgi:hypothetical protein